MIQKTYSFNISLWKNNSIKTENIKNDFDEIVGTCQTLNLIRLSDIQMKANNDIYYKTYFGNDWILLKGDCHLFVGGVEIDPLNSYFINEYNCMLPIIKYKETTTDYYALKFNKKERETKNATIEEYIYEY